MRISDWSSDVCSSDLEKILVHIQNDLFDVGADLCNPVTENPEYPPLRVEQDYIDRLEKWCDHYNEQLPNLRSFILNGGTPAARTEESRDGTGGASPRRPRWSLNN